MGAPVPESTLWPVRRWRAIGARWQDRLVGLVLAIPSGGVLGTALLLTPDPSGMGTHRQLGLGQCTVLALTGFPCPMCGMTTTFTHLAHFQVIDGVLNQPFGLVLFSATVIGFAIGLSDVLAPRGLWRRALRVIQRHEGLFAMILLCGMLLGWLYKIAAVLGWFGPGA